MVDLETQYYRIACLNGKWRGGMGAIARKALGSNCNEISY